MRKSQFSFKLRLTIQIQIPRIPTTRLYTERSSKDAYSVDLLGNMAIPVPKEKNELKAQSGKSQKLSSFYEEHIIWLY